MGDARWEMRDVRWEMGDGRRSTFVLSDVGLGTWDREQGGRINLFEIRSL